MNSSTLSAQISNIPVDSGFAGFVGELKDIVIALIGIVGVVIGIVLNEYYRRKDRETLFAEGIFKKKLNLYENLHNIMMEAYSVADEMLSDKKMTKTQRKKQWSGIIFPIAEFLDEHELYINDEISSHCIISLIGVDDIPDMEEKGKKAELEKLNQSKKDLTNLIKEESGLRRLDSFFGKINKPRIKSDYIDMMKDVIKKGKNTKKK